VKSSGSKARSKSVSTGPEVSAQPSINDQGTGVIELITYPGYPNTCGIFGYMPETHQAADTSERYNVHIYSSVAKLIENNDPLKQQLCAATFRLLHLHDQGDVMFIKGSELAVADDVLVYNDLEVNLFYWFTVTQAKSYFGPEYEPRFGAVERMAWATLPNVKVPS
jgi:hypothetical protein